MHKLTLALAVALTTAVAHAGPITSGHADLDIDYAGGAMSLSWKTYNPMSAGTPINDDNYPFAGNPVSVPLANAYTVPAGASFACLGAAGSTVYRLKQAQDVTQVWLGYNTQGVPANTFVGNKVTLKFKGIVAAPAGARFVLYTTNAFGTPTYLLNSTAGGCNKTSFDISNNIHAHAWWAFSHAGNYTLRFEATGTLVPGLGGLLKTTGDVDVTFAVP